VQKIANTPKNKSICFKIQGYFDNLIVLKKGKTKKLLSQSKPKFYFQ